MVNNGVFLTHTISGGIYYRKDIYQELGLSEPANFDDMLSNCEAMIASGRKCYTIGNKWLWTGAGWF